MANYVLVYTGGSMAETPEAQEAAMQAWGAWFGTLGEAVVEGGAPFGASGTIKADGATSDGGASKLTGYSIITADSVADAQAKSKGCPVLAGGGAVEVYEVIPM